MRLGSIAVTPSPPQIANQKSAKDAQPSILGVGLAFSQNYPRGHISREVLYRMALTNSNIRARW